MRLIIRLEGVLVSNEHAADAFADAAIAGLSKDPNGLLLRETTATDIVGAVVEHSWASRPESMITQIASDIADFHSRPEVTSAVVQRAINLGVRMLSRKIATGGCLDRKWTTGSHTALSRLPSMGSHGSRGVVVGAGLKMVIYSELPESVARLLLERAGFAASGNYRLVAMEDRITAYGRILGELQDPFGAVVAFVSGGFPKGSMVKIAFENDRMLALFTEQLEDEFVVVECPVDRTQPRWEIELEQRLFAPAEAAHTGA